MSLIFEMDWIRLLSSEVDLVSVAFIRLQHARNVRRVPQGARDTQRSGNFLHRLAGTADARASRPCRTMGRVGRSKGIAMKVVMWIVLIIFLVGLAVLVGLGKLIF